MWHFKGAKESWRKLDTERYKNLSHPQGKIVLVGKFIRPLLKETGKSRVQIYRVATRSKTNFGSYRQRKETRHDRENSMLRVFIENGGE